MDSELALVSRMIATGQVEKVIAAGVEPRHFFDLVCRQVYETCLDHVRVWRVPPSAEAIRRRHPDFKLMPVNDDLGYLIKEFVDDCSMKAGVEKWRDIGLMLDKADAGDPEARGRVAELFMEHAREMATLIPIPHSSRLSDMADRIVSIRRQQEASESPGVKIGIPCLDPFVHVVRPTELVVHTAYSGVGKTTGLVRSSVSAYEQEDGPVLFFSLEMSEGEIWEIFDSRVAQLSRESIFKRRLSTDDYERYQRAAERVKGAENDIIVIDDSDGSPTIDKLAALVDRYGPKTVCVDYLSLMEAHIKTSNDWERVAMISKGLKRLARAYKIKVYAAAQNSADAVVNGPTEDNVAFSRTIFHDCNLMVGYHQDREMEKKRQVQVRLVKARGRAKPLQHAVEYWDRDAMVFETWTSQHEFRLKAQKAFS